MSTTSVILVPALAVTLALAGGACGDGGGDRQTGPVGGSEAPPSNGLAFGVSSDPEPPESGEAVTWQLTVRNVTDEEITLTFPSGKSGDVALFRDGEEVYRWSNDRFFTDAIRHETLMPNEEIEYRLEEPVLSLEPGRYEVEATLASDPAPNALRGPVTVDRSG